MLESSIYGDGEQVAGVELRGNGYGLHKGVGAGKGTAATRGQVVGRIGEVVDGNAVARLPLGDVGRGAI